MVVEVEAMEVMVVQALVVVMMLALVLVLAAQVDFMVERDMEAVVAIILTQDRTCLRSSIEVALGFQNFSISHHLVQ